jgi:hypothetical protein
MVLFIAYPLSFTSKERKAKAPMITMSYFYRRAKGAGFTTADCTDARTSSSRPQEIPNRREDEVSGEEDKNDPEAEIYLPYPLHR